MTKIENFDFKNSDELLDHLHKKARNQNNFLHYSYHKNVENQNSKNTLFFF